MGPASGRANAARIKDIATVSGMRGNQLVGYGLVVGLAGTGDKRQTVFSTQTLSNILQRMGVSVAPTALQVKNTAAVLVTAVLPPMAEPGTAVDVTVAAIGDSPTIMGGLLIGTPLKGADGKVYAVAQGSVVLGGYSAGRRGSGQTVNHPTTGRIPNGAIVEVGAPHVPLADPVHLQLSQADYTNASRVIHAVNQKFGPACAKAENAGLLLIKIPDAFRDRPVDFLAELEAITVEVDTLERVVINERTGTITVGSAVHLAPVSVIHGNLTIEIQEAEQVSQPEGLTGSTATVTQTNVKAKEDAARTVTLPKGATIEALVRALVAQGSSPRDVIAILQTLQAMGALQARIEVI